jgi:hypothetical protein
MTGRPLTLGVRPSALDQLTGVVPPVVDEESPVIGSFKESRRVARSAGDDRIHERGRIVVPLSGVRDVLNVESGHVAIIGVVERPPPQRVEMSDQMHRPDTEQPCRLARLVMAQ